MLALFFEVDQRVLLVRFSDTVEEADVALHRSLRLRFNQSEGDVPIIIDLSAVEKVALPTIRIRSAGENAWSHLGRSQIVVARRGTVAFGLARMFNTIRSESGHSTPALLPTLEEAFAQLGLSNPHFTAWPAE